MRPFPRRTAAQCGVFTTAQALPAGWTSAALRHAVTTGRVHRLRTGAYQVADPLDVRPDLSAFEQARWQHAAPAVAAVLMTPCALASHSTGAVLHGLPLIFLPERACVCVVPHHTGEIRGVHVHRCQDTPGRITLGAVESTTVGRTCIDLAREHGVASGVVALDFALHEGLVTPAQLEAELALCHRWPGVRAAREAIDFCDGRSESVLESRSRLAIGRHGLPAPDLQISIGTENGRFVARVDFYWDEFGVVGESDGAMKYDGTDPTPLIQEKYRQEALEGLDLTVVRWGTPDLKDFGPTAARLRRKFRAGAGRPRAERRWTVLTPRL